MAKLLVIDKKKGSKVPFLRGMLTRSLQDAGLSFGDAFQLATDVREDLDDTDEITTEELRARIIEDLTEEHPQVIQRYRKEGIFRENVQVVYSDGHSVPFSRNLHAQRLESCSLPREKCVAVTGLIHGKLIKNKQREITTAELTATTYRTILDELNQEYADYYLISNDFIDNDQPLLVLLGGVPGSGKSTVATELATALGIVRTQSTDMLREVMRILIPKRVAPRLHTSSFNTNKAETNEIYEIPDADSLLYGFQQQSELVEVACQAVLQRALNERVSMIIEGVHIRPSLLSHIPESDAVIVPFMLGVLDKDILISHIKRRRASTEQRRATRYLEKIDEIWQLQSALLSEADNENFSILNNLDSEHTVSEIIKTITETIAATYEEPRVNALRNQFMKLLK